MEPRGGQPRPVPTGLTVFQGARVVVTFSPDLGDISDAAIAVRGNVIAWVGPSSQLPHEFAHADEVVDCTDRVIIPGMVNTHHHMYQSLTRCIAQDSPLFNWLVALYPAWATMTGADAYVSAKLAMAELLLSGCTCTSDHLYIYPNDVALDDTIRAARHLGMRFHPTRGIMTLGRSQGAHPPRAAGARRCARAGRTGGAGDRAWRPVRDQQLAAGAQFDLHCQTLAITKLHGRC